MTIEAINNKRMKDMSKRKVRPRINVKKENRDILFIVLTLYLIGVIFILSSSSANLVVDNKNPFFYVRKQLLFGMISIIPFCFAYFINIKYILKCDKFILFCSAIILIFVAVAGKEVGGNKSWLGVGSFGIQPSEFIKLSLILCSVNYLKNMKLSKNDIQKTFFVFALLIGLVALQKDLGSVVILCAVAFFLLFVAGISYKWLLVIGILAGCAISGAIILAPHRMQRLLIFTNPFKDYYGYGYQTIQSLYAIANGGLFGRGIYESVQKYGFLPECHTDFIFSIIVEEIGLVGALIVLSLFILLITKTFKIAYSLKNKEHTLIVASIGCLLAFEAIMNLCVTVSLLPVVGVTLPFITYGGSSLMAKVAGIGLILNINKNGEKIDENQLLSNAREDLEIKRNQIKKVKRTAINTKNSINASIQGAFSNIRTRFAKKTKTNIVSNSKVELSSNVSEVKTDIRDEIIENEPNSIKDIPNEKLPTFDIPKIKLDVKGILSNATSTKTKVVDIEKTSGLKNIKIKKKK